MRKRLLALLLVAACGGKTKHVDTVPLPPDPKVAEEEKKPVEEKPADPPAPTPQPLDVPIATPKPTVKLVNAGKGKKAALKIAPKAGAKQTIEVALDFIGGQDGPPEAGGKQDQTAPTVILAADIETKEVGTDGQSKFQLTISGVEAKDAPGSKVPAAQFKSELQALIGSSIAGSVGADGSTTGLTLHMDAVSDQKQLGALAYLKTALLPLWPVLPAEAIGPGAKWTVTSTEKIADQVEVTKTVNYELVANKSGAWTIKGTTKLTGADQELIADPEKPDMKAKVGSIGGGGTIEATVTDGALVSPVKQKMTSDFTITAQTVNIKFHLEQSNAVTTK
ncbi:MAG TPA: hypothetical protein VMZ53_31030 [Kofleriaceae bacterium]|nr:hypothetical protein [Kofleriaceae bacterium]